MTLAELHERIGWQLEGRLQVRGGPTWLDWPSSNISSPGLYEDANLYRRRPDPAPMPDEVWIAHYPSQSPPSAAPGTYFRHQAECVGYNKGAKPIRYVRVGAIIPASQMQFRQRIRNWEWSDCIETNEYRIKP